MKHIPVLLDEVIRELRPERGARVIDATANGGGHAGALLKAVVPGGKVLAIEWDTELYAKLTHTFSDAIRDGVMIAENDTFTNIKRIVERNHFGPVDGVVFDLGFSSYHVDESGRGFSFQKNEPLDMRFNKSLQYSAIDVVNTYSREDLVRILAEYGEESFAPRIADAIVEARRQGAIGDTAALAFLVERAVPRWYRARRIHPATKTFQAIRIEVNHEMDNIAEGINGALDVLSKQGRIAVISFHAVEDRVVKQLFQKEAKAGRIRIITKHVIKPGRMEIVANPRARSAKLRIIEKL